jgi:hypothetical protein
VIVQHASRKSSTPQSVAGVAALYSCSNGKVKFLILNRLQVTSSEVSSDALVILLQLDCKDDVVEIDEHVVLSQTGQWLFILKEHLSDHAAAKKQPGKQQLCYGYWFMLEAEASEMVSAMQTVVNRLLLEQVRAACCRPVSKPQFCSVLFCFVSSNSALFCSHGYLLRLQHLNVRG